MSFLNMFRDWKDVEDHEEGAVIFSERDPADVLFVILSGEVELTLNGESLGVERPGGIIGEMAMIESATRRATAKALTGVRLARLDREQLKDLVDRNPEFSIHVMIELANRLRAVDKYISDQIGSA